MLTLLIILWSLVTPNPTSATMNTIETWSPAYPVLKNKDENQLLRINIPISDSEEGHVAGTFTINLSEAGTEALTQLQLFSSDSMPEFSDVALLGTVKNPSTETSFECEAHLHRGNNYFWVTGRVHDQVPLQTKFEIRCTETELDGHTINVEYRPALPKRLGIALRQHNDDGVHTFRIPGLATTNDGTLIGVYDTRRNGSVDLQEDIDVAMNRSTDGGETWSSMQVIMDMGSWGDKPESENGIGDPSILVDRELGTIWVAGIWAHGHPGKRNWFASKQGMLPQETSQFMLTKSDDDGVSWSAPINITPQIKNPNWHLVLQGPGKGISLDDGTLVFPAQFKDEDEMPHSTIISSLDHGKTWKIGTGAKSNTTEAQVVQMQDGSLMLNMRDNRGRAAGGATGDGARSVAVTSDLGQSWTEHPTSGKVLPEPVCMGSLISWPLKDSDKDLFLFSNPNDHYQRRNITIKASFDEGNTWPSSYHTLLDEGRGRGYSCMTRIDDQTVGILYESSQADLVFQKISLSDIIGESSQR